MALSQPQLIIRYIKARGAITPARLAGKFFGGAIFGSEVSRRCRELRKAKLLISVRNDQYVTFMPSAKLRKFFAKKV